MRFTPVIFLLFLFLDSFCVYGQEKRLPCVKKIVQSMEDWEFFEALEECNECLEDHPNSAEVYYQRGLVHFYLNHLWATAQDFEKVLSLGIPTSVLEEEEFLRWYGDTVFIIQAITDSLIFPTLKPELNYRKQTTMADTLQGMLRPERSCFDVTYEKLTFKVIPDARSIEGSNEITFKVLADTKIIQLDLYDYMEVLDITWNGRSVPYTRKFNAIFISFDAVLESGNDYTIKVSYKGSPREAPDPPWNGGFVWKKNGDRHFVGVSCEHLGASSWWPNKDHLSDKPDSMEIFILAPTGYDVVSNGNLVSETADQNGYSRFHWHVSYPINNYNVTFYMGDFVNFNENYVNRKNQNVNIDYYVLAENLERAKTYYSGTKQIILAFENLFGPYPFPKDGLAFVESPYAGMEHQSAIAIGGDYGKDSIYDMVGIYDLLVIHEAAHEWWGNSVAIGDMADVWINEGFATYSEHLFIESEFGKEKYFKAVGENMFEISNIWPMVGLRNVNDNAFVGQDVYYKGAAMLHCLRAIMNNDAAFFRMIKEFYTTATMKISTSADFVAHSAKYTPIDLNGFFEVFMHQSAPPTLEYSFDLSEGNLKFNYRWVGVPENFQMPFLLVINWGLTHRVECTPDWNSVSFQGVQDFYVFSQGDCTETDLDLKNAFTYFFSKYVP